MKGAINSITLVEAFITTLLIITSTSAFSTALNEEFKSKMTGVQAQRIDNVALTLSSTPNSSIELDMEGYTVSYESQEIKVGYGGNNSTVDFPSGKYGYDDIQAPRDPVTINSEYDNVLCVKRSPEIDDSSYSAGQINPLSGRTVSYDYTLVIEPGACS